jgi:hypothetical protein
VEDENAREKDQGEEDDEGTLKAETLPFQSSLRMSPHPGMHGAKREKMTHHAAQKSDTGRSKTANTAKMTNVTGLQPMVLHSSLGSYLKIAVPAGDVVSVRLRRRGCDASGKIIVKLIYN